MKEIRRVMIIEDDADMIDLLSVVLRRGGTSRSVPWEDWRACAS